MTRVGHALLTLVAAACLIVGCFAGCSGSTPRDKNYGTDAESDFVPPDAGAPDSGANGGAAGAAGAAGAGTAGAAGAGQAGSDGGSNDGSTDTVSDGGTA